ncbi:hypothetical protein ABFX02_06G197900 [Erythranthe guttata]
MKSEEIQRHLPEEIVIEILSKLPIKSVLRFKCVCRSWLSLISTEHFIVTYLRNSANDDETFDLSTKILTTPSKCSRAVIKACSLRSLITEPVTRVFSLDFPTDNSRDLLIVGSCKGLICIVMVDKYRFFLWNPTTSERKELPDFFAGVNHRNRNRGFIARHGFGYDESSGDYKIYVVYRLSYRPLVSVARLYSLKADSWGEVVSVIDGSLFDAGRFVSGKLHWRSDYEMGSNWIVSFDLKSETFGTIEKPNCLKDYVMSGLGVLKGRLCAYFDYPENIATIGFDIWIWNEYGVEDSWSRLLTISYLSVSWRPKLWASYGPITPVFVLPNDEVLFTYSSDFFTYNPKDNWVRKLNTVDFDLDGIRDAHVYTESLVSLVPDYDGEQA